VHYSLILAFVSVMLVPVTYYIAIAVWHPRGAREKIQYLAGLAMYIFLGPFLNITVLLFALRGIDNFAWGKTRKVVETKEVGGNETPVIDEKSSRKLTKPQPVFSS
jgi:chitin synthase